MGDVVFKMIFRWVNGIYLKLSQKFARKKIDFQKKTSEVCWESSISNRNFQSNQISVKFIRCASAYFKTCCLTGSCDSFPESEPLLPRSDETTNASNRRTELKKLQTTVYFITSYVWKTDIFPSLWFFHRRFLNVALHLCCLCKKDSLQRTELSLPAAP